MSTTIDEKFDEAIENVGEVYEAGNKNAGFEDVSISDLTIIEPEGGIANVDDNGVLEIASAVVADPLIIEFSGYADIEIVVEAVDSLEPNLRILIDDTLLYSPEAPSVGDVFNYTGYISESIKFAANFTELKFNKFKRKSDGELSAFKNMDNISYFFYSNCNSYYLDKLNELDLANIKRAQYVFQDNTTAKTIKMPNMPSLTLIHGMFLRCTSVEYIEVDTSLVNVVTDLFNGCSSLKEIGKPLDFSKSSYVTRTFQNCEALEKVSFTGTINKSISFQWSTLLTHDSLMSIINALYDYSSDTSGTTYELTIGSENYAKLSDEEISIARNKGWEVA